MIGTKMPKNSDLYIFLEEGDVELLKTETLTGKLMRHHTNIDEIVMKVTKKSVGMLDLNWKDTLNITIPESTYEKIRIRGSTAPHLGYCHVYIIDVGQSTFEEKMLYNTLVKERI